MRVLKYSNKIIFFFLSCFVLSNVFIFSHEVALAKEKENDISFYTCGMHPSVNVSPDDYNKGSTTCPICKMDLIPVYKDSQVKAEDSASEGVINRVKVKSQELNLLGIKTIPASKQHLIKEVRTIGMVAYDPELAIAQDEFISSLKTLERVKESETEDAIRRSEELVKSSRKKLKLLGLGDEQIAELERNKFTEDNLILPQKDTWIYGEAYEYELFWIKPNEKIVVTSSNLPGEKFEGLIASVNPTVDRNTRSITFRAKVNNPELKLKPDMYVDIMISSFYASDKGDHMNLAIPKDALVDTGIRKIVWVDLGGGNFEGREVETGPEALANINGVNEKYLPILSGLKEGEIVVTKGNFLIDSQSQITGVVSSAYGGAIEESKGSPVEAKHQH